MELALSPFEQAFAGEVERFLNAQLPPAWCGIADSDTRARPDVALLWQQKLAAQGWLTPSWPIECGGCDWTPMQHHIFKTACAARRAPKLSTMAFGMVGPLICKFGTPEQRDEYLPRIVNGEDIWCQGFSEPGAGSDLAALKTTARRDGDVYIVTGQKIWTTYAHVATRMMALLRTNPSAPRPQAGISMLIIDMKLPGITVRPIRTIDGEHHFNEVFFDDVRVPAAGLLGAENQGWDAARSLLGFERSGIADVVPSRQVLAGVAAIAAAETRGNGSLLEDEDFSLRLARLDIKLDALEIFELRVMAAAGMGAHREHDPSLLKILGTELKQEIHALGLEALGLEGTMWPDDTAAGGNADMRKYLATDALFYRAASIYGGTNEVQRNIIAKSLLRQQLEL